MTEAKVLRGPLVHEDVCDALLSASGDGDLLYVEGGSHDDQTRVRFAELNMPPVMNVERGTIWPKRRVYHLPAVEGLKLIGDLFRRLPVPEVADHLILYNENGLILKWYDVADGDCELVGDSARFEAELKKAGFELSDLGVRR